MSAKMEKCVATKKNGRIMADANEELLKKFNIKPCQVNLIRGDFSKIRITCDAVTSGEKLNCKLSQDGEINFTLQVKRKRNMKDDSHLNTEKRFKGNL